MKWRLRFLSLYLMFGQYVCVKCFCKKKKKSLKAIFKTRNRQIRTRIQQMRRAWRTRRIRRTRWIQWIQRIWGIQRTRWIWRTRRIWRIRRMPYAIFKRFSSFIYSATKGFISSSKLSSELYLAEAWTTNKY